ncbi:T3SS effector HopA1 family protein [Crossiella sp. SN42]|uniref:T3SS effector HopA1 family protein n=1 Tax=Crossiella sp. SN42 TaxID=2944808 RepID=UPI00207C7A24|nr:T3SS effector HopA1 family protein [Crossiella sp. SN42]MCO1580507.1 T3SS effector HopA1 family protein [Crossiella sp. SN42]
MTVDSTALADRLAAAMARIQIDAAGHLAVLGPRELRATTAKDLSRALALACYEVLHVGWAQPRSGSTRSRRDHAFEHRLAAAVPHRETPVTVEFLERDPVAGRVLVRRDGVRVWLPANTISGHLDHAPGSPLTLRRNPARPALSPGFFLVDSSRPPVHSPAQLRVYLHLRTAESAPAVWAIVLNTLHTNEIAYRAKVISEPGSFPRRDGLVVYLGEGNWHAADLIAAAVEGHPGLGAEVSVFAEALGSGVATAWEPVDHRPGMRGLSFGQHRAHVLATALLAAAHDGESPETAVRRAFGQARIDPGNPARNLT